MKLVGFFYESFVGNFETKLSCFFQSQDKSYWKRQDYLHLPEKHLVMGTM
jgi:hypothetical protein